MPQLDCAAGRLVYHDLVPAPAGAPTVMALHSSAASGRQWRALAAVLAPGWRVLAPDLIGHGGTPMTGGAILEDELALLTALAGQIDGPFHLAGHSYGAAMALELARRMPQRVISLALYEPVSFAVLKGSGHDEAWAEIDGVARRHVALVEAGDPAAAAAAFLDYWIGPGALQTLPAEQQQYVAGCMPRIAADWRALFGTRLAADHFAGLAMPVLLLSGGRTTLAARSVADTLARLLSHARREILPGLGHMAPMSQPDRVIPAFAAFLSEMAARQPAPAG